MSLPVQNVAPQAVAAPGQLIFPFAWRCDDSLLVKVYVNDAVDGGFAVALNADQTASPGGTITRGVACLGGEVVTVERASALAQGSTFLRYGAFQGDTVTNILDKAVMLLQELSALIGRAVRTPRSLVSKFASLDLPTPTAGDLLCFLDAGGGQCKLGTKTVASLSALTEASGEPVARTGAGTYQLAHVPNPLARVKVFLNGARQTLGTHYTITAGGLITQQAGFISDPAEVMLADYTY